MTAPEHPETALPIVIDVGELVGVDAAIIDALARLQLTARRLGRRIVLRHVSTELEGMLEFAGLSDILPTAPELPVKVRGETEEREQAFGVEEEADPADPIV